MNNPASPASSPEPPGAPPGGCNRAAAGALIHRRAVEADAGKEILAEWFGSDLSARSAKGFYPSAQRRRCSL